MSIIGTYFGSFFKGSVIKIPTGGGVGYDLMYGIFMFSTLYVVLNFLESQEVKAVRKLFQLTYFRCLKVKL